MVSERLLEVVACPKCRGALTSKSGQVNCATCRLRFPAYSGIPWLFRDPVATFLDWRHKIQFHLQTMTVEISQADNWLAQTKSPLARERLARIGEALRHNFNVLSDLLKPFLGPAKMKQPLYQAVKSELPLSQRLMGYYANLHRDWCWGEREHRATHDLIGQLKPTTAKWGKVLVLGAGAGRLAVDLSAAADAELVVALDINPLLVLFGQRVAAGQDLDYYEFPVAPLNLQSVAVKGQCHAPTKAGDKLEWLFADGMNPPFRDQSFDTVVTPWFIDIVPQNLSALAARINRLLKLGGGWLNFGPYGFLGQPWPDQLSPVEITETVVGQGFHSLAERQTYLPYLQSPHSGQRREESVFGFWVEKKSPVIEPAPFRNYPAWLTDFEQPVVPSEKLIQYQYATRVQSEILAKIDGRHSIRDLAKEFADHHRVDMDDALGAIVTLLRQLWDGA